MADDEVPGTDVATVEPAVEAPPDTLAEKYRKQGAALMSAAKHSPFTLYKGMLKGMADELRDVVTALRQAEGDEIENPEIVPAAMLQKGVRVYWPNEGPGRVLRTANQFTGIEIAWDEPGRGVSFVNVLGGQSPVVVIP